MFRMPSDSAILGETKVDESKEIAEILERAFGGSQKIEQMYENRASLELCDTRLAEKMVKELLDDGVPSRAPSCSRTDKVDLTSDSPGGASKAGSKRKLKFRVGRITPSSATATAPVVDIATDAPCSPLSPSKKKPRRRVLETPSPPPSTAKRRASEDQHDVVVVSSQDTSA